MHPVDLYFTQESYLQGKTVLRSTVTEYKRVLKIVEHRVSEFLSVTEKQLMFGQINSDIFEKNRQYVDKKPCFIILPQNTKNPC